ncbi:MAG: hypothetical protein ACLPWS_16320 [Rhodomicrobium sp.]
MDDYRLIGAKRRFLALVNGWAASRIDELLPWAQGFASPTSTAETQIAA